MKLAELSFFGRQLCESAIQLEMPSNKVSFFVDFLQIRFSLFYILRIIDIDSFRHWKPVYWVTFINQASQELSQRTQIAPACRRNLGEDIRSKIITTCGNKTAATGGISQRHDSVAAVYSRPERLLVIYKAGERQNAF